MLSKGRTRLLALGALVAALSLVPQACGTADEPTPTPVSLKQEPLTRSPKRLFVDAREVSELTFRHYRDSNVLSLGGGVAVGDFNNDGLPDLYVVNSNGPNSLYRNNDDGRFTDVAEAIGVAGPIPSGNGAGWADYDNDGDLDLFVAAWGSSRLFRNSGPPSFTFTDVTDLAGVGDPDRTYRTMGIAWGDYDADGYLDLLVVRHITEDHLKHPNLTTELSKIPRSLALYRNEGDGAFSNRTTLLGDPNVFPSGVLVAGFKPAFLDYDNDGDADIYLVNDMGAQLYPNVLLRNDGPNPTGRWRFTDVSAKSGAGLAIFGMGLAVGDYDNDSDLDMYMTNIGPNQLLRNEGDGTFTNQTDVAGVGHSAVPNQPGAEFNFHVGWGAGFFDYNNDGYLDLYAVAGLVEKIPLAEPLAQPNAIFLNNGDGTFTDVSLLSGAADPGIGRDVALADFNGDGCVDIFVVNMGEGDGTPGHSKAYWNRCDYENNWLAIKTVGSTSNRDGIGARITVHSNGLTQVREMGSSQHHVSSSLVSAHFGLGKATQVDAVEIRWPSGRVQILTDIHVNQRITVVEP